MNKPVLFRCSGLSKLMTQPQTKSPREKYDEAVASLNETSAKYEGTANKATATAAKMLEKIAKLEVQIKELEGRKDEIHLSVTAKTYINQMIRQLKWERRESVSNKYTQKGNEAEGDSTTLFTLQLGMGMIYKNQNRLNNDWITGEPDLATKSGDILPYDIKSSWDWSTFPYPDMELDNSYYWQNMGYMALTGAKSWTTAYCLVNTPAELIERERNSIWYRMGCPDKASEEWLEQAIIHERNSIYDMEAFQRRLAITNYPYEWSCNPQEWAHDVPAAERIMLFKTDRDEEAIADIYAQVEKARQYIALKDKGGNAGKEDVFATLGQILNPLMP